MKSNFLLFFKVVIEGLVETKSWGDIAVDDIKVLDGLGVTDCKGEDFFFACFAGRIPVFRSCCEIGFSTFHCRLVGNCVTVCNCIDLSCLWNRS